MSVPRWLAEQVGPTRSVVATDIDTTWLAGPSVDRVQMLRHDIGTQDPPGTDLDLVHARLVLTQVKHCEFRRDARACACPKLCTPALDLLLRRQPATGMRIRQPGGDPPICQPNLDVQGRSDGLVAVPHGPDTRGPDEGTTQHRAGVLLVRSARSATIRAQLLDEAAHRVAP
jgi:hypothetical protein